MRNKMILIVGALVVLFVALYFINDYKNKRTLEVVENPYGKETLHQETIDIMDDPLYQNIIVLYDFDAQLGVGENISVYYFSTTCVNCQKMKPVVVPLDEELDVDLKKMNMLEIDNMI